MKKFPVFTVILFIFMASCVAHSDDEDRVLDMHLKGIDECVEGYVIFSLTVRDNQAVDPKIVESKPEGVFDAHAKSAIRRIYFDAPDGTFIPEHRIAYDQEGCSEKD